MNITIAIECEIGLGEELGACYAAVRANVVHKKTVIFAAVRQSCHDLTVNNLQMPGVAPEIYKEISEGVGRLGENCAYRFMRKSPDE